MGFGIVRSQHIVPTYSYACKKCDHTMDVFHGMTANPRVKCDACGSTRMERLLGIGAGIMFKGSGFYETDYKTKRGDKKDGKAAKDSGATKSESAAKSDSGAKSDASGSSSKSTGKGKGGSGSTAAA